MIKEEVSEAHSELVLYDHFRRSDQLNLAFLEYLKPIFVKYLMRLSLTQFLPRAALRVH